MSSFTKTTKKQSNVRRIDISNRVFVVVTRFQGKTWYHIRQSAKDKCVSLMKDELSALFLKKDDLKEAGVHLKNAETVRAAAQVNDDSSDRANKGSNKRRGNVSFQEKTSKKRGGIKRRRSAQNTVDMQSDSESDDSDNDGSITTQGANADYWESD